MTFGWEQISGPSIDLIDEDTLAPSFETPSLSSDATVILRLTANDGVNPPVSDDVAITIRNVDTLNLVVSASPDALPLLMLKGENPDLPIALTIVAGEGELSSSLAGAGSDGMFASVLAGANMSGTNGVPDLVLAYPFRWRGDFVVGDASWTDFGSLIGQAIAAPSNFPSDVRLLNAALRRNGLTAGVNVTITEFDSLDAMTTAFGTGAVDGLAVFAPQEQIPLGASPAASVLDVQSPFSGALAVPSYASFPDDMLPIGGLVVKADTLLESGKVAALELVLPYYSDAALRLTTNPDSYVANIASLYDAEFPTVSGTLGDGSTLVDSVTQTRLVFRSDLDMNTIAFDLEGFLVEVNGAAPPNFISTQFGPYDSGPSAAVPVDVVDALAFALADERKARATYLAVIARFGAVNPFVNIARAEQAHIDSLLGLYGTYELPVPADETVVDPAVSTATFQQLCAIGVQAEIDNIALYDDQLLPIVAGYDDITDVMVALRNASEYAHLPAFQRCAG
ncbi:MAG: DUF2202 domain-containing protein [Hyphomonas sp.]